MIFEFKNLGSIKEAQIEMGKLTVICGKNNTGKTYLMYGVYGFLTSWASIVTEENQNAKSKENFDKITSKYNGLMTVNTHNQNDIGIFFKNICKTIIQKMYLFFSSNVDEFIRSELDLIDFHFYYNKSKMEIQIANTVWESPKAENIKTLVFHELKNIFDKVFILTAERTQTRLFQKELDIIRNQLINEKRFDILEKNLSNISIPIRDNLDFARITDLIIKNNSFLKEEYPELLQAIEEILGVNYEVNEGMLRVYDKKANHAIPHYMASTSVRSLADMHLWLKHQAQKGDLLMIDEPELNLHPENQIKMARLFTKLVNAGIRVWITTHSDYIVKELNNLIMLSQSPKKENLLEELKEYGYTPNDLLKPDDVRFYTAVYDEKLEGCTVIKSKIGKYGIETPSFDETLDNLLFVSSKIENSLD